jgi:formylmethanofuran dehydrogenase subunit E
LGSDRKSQLRDTLERARYFHGHICPFVVLGIKASTVAMNKLGVERLSFDESVGERILAMVECNNCFTDGVQVATGCTLGNNCLVYFDLGKNAVTLVRRSSWEGVRVYMDAEKLREKHFSKEALDLFEKVVARREGSREDERTLSRVWEEIGYKMLEIPEDEFKIDTVKVPPIERAPIFESIRCQSCGELAMETRAVRISGKAYCLKCASKRHYVVIGRGIVKLGEE